MIVEIAETVLTYDAGLLQAWRNGDKSIAEGLIQITPNYLNQPSYGFGEAFTLRHFYETEGWSGFASYALGPQYPGSRRRQTGRKKVEQVIPAERLAKLRTLRSRPSQLLQGGGEPDLFLYRDDGSFGFVEVKKEKDRLSEPQLTCIAQVLAVLGCDVRIVYLRSRGHSYHAKSYCFDLVRLQGSAR